MSLPKLKVLVIDDSHVMRKVVINMIKLLPNYEVEIFDAENGIQAEQILQDNWLHESPIQLIVSDWMMPEMSGVELLEKIRGVDHFKEVPVVMLTAETYNSQMARCIELGVYGYITKPFTQEELLSVIEKCVLEKIKPQQPLQRAS